MGKLNLWLLPNLEFHFNDDNIVTPQALYLLEQGMLSNIFIHVGSTIICQLF